MITDRLMLPASWSLKLKDSTPKSLLDKLDLDVAAFGHVVVTPTHVDAHAVTGATLLSIARYTGIYRSRPSQFELGGPGLAAWLGDEDGKGNLIEVTYSGNTTFVPWVTGINTQLVAGTYTAVTGPGPLDHDFLRIDRRTALDFICTYFGAEWRVNPDGTLDAGAEADLFVTDPTAVVQKRSGGRDQNVVGVKADLGLARDFDDYTTRVYLHSAPSNGSANISPATPYRDLQGNLVDWTRLVEAIDTKTAHANAVAQAQLNLFTNPRKATTLSADAYDIGADFSVGDSIYVYDPELGLVDVANEVQYRGETIHPTIQRVLGTTWPVQQGMGVYFRAPTAAGLVTDLTDHVEFETGATTIDVGAQLRASR